MELSPLVSVVVPAYCHAEFIEDCLRSIHAQTYPEIELIVVDDLSTDDTFARAEALLQGDFAARFRRVRLLRNERNLGAHDAINRGIAESEGSHIALINSDDLYHPDRVRALMAALAETGAELGFSLVEVMAKPDEVSSIEPYFQLFAPRQLLALERDPSVGFALMRLNVAISTGNLLFSRRLYDRVGAFRPMKYCHDWDFLLQALWWTEPVVVRQELYRYRLHGTNSFSSLGYLAATEIEAVLRRFFRLGLRGASPNPLFPCAFNWPGVFELYVQQCGHLTFLDRERGRSPRHSKVPF
ncbi:glycosyltransferase family 2 protein [Cereibacter sphaeroides]|nr:glycosyltransferase family 2 protein [Cereibacter sphaeroides]